MQFLLGFAVGAACATAVPYVYDFGKFLVDQSVSAWGKLSRWRKFR